MPGDISVSKVTDYSLEFEVAFFWVVTLYSDVVGYQRFGGLCCLHLQVMTPCNYVAGYHLFGGP